MYGGSAAMKASLTSLVDVTATGKAISWEQRANEHVAIDSNRLIGGTSTVLRSHNGTIFFTGGK